MTRFTDEQVRSAFKTHGSISAAARALVTDRRGLARRLRTLGVTDYSEPAPAVEKPFKRYIIIPDCQVKPGVPLDYLHHIGKYISDQNPDVVVNLGDFADMPSLSSYDRGKKSFEGRRYKKDIEAVHKGLSILSYYVSQTGAEAHMLYGNHENRITRAVENQPELDGVIGLDDLQYELYRWKTHDFLKPVQLDGICFSHYFVSGVMGRPIVTAQTLLNRKHQSCIAGHQQGKQIAYATRADGRTITGIIVGSAYAHDEDYLGPQANKHWRGIVVLNEVKEGTFDEMFVSLDYLARR